MGFYSFDGNVPRLHPDAFIHPEAVLIGRVIVERGCYVGAGAILRGDIGVVHLEQESNIQEGCVVHTFPNKMTRICERAHVGHSAIVHGAQIGKNSLIGISCVVLDDSVIGQDVILGAMSLVPKNSNLESGYLYFGNPAKRIRKLTNLELDNKRAGTNLYVGFAANNGQYKCDPQICADPKDHDFSENSRIFWE